MPHKRKEDFINDKRRVSYLHAVYSRIYRHQSILIEGEYGVGKTRFLDLIKPKKRKILWVESLNNIHEILASILQQLDYDAPPAWRRKSKHLDMIKAIQILILNSGS